MPRVGCVLLRGWCRGRRDQRRRRVRRGRHRDLEAGLDGGPTRVRRPQRHREALISVDRRRRATDRARCRIKAQPVRQTRRAQRQDVAIGIGEQARRQHDRHRSALTHRPIRQACRRHRRVVHRRHHQVEPGFRRRARRIGRRHHHRHRPDIAVARRARERPRRRVEAQPSRQRRAIHQPRRVAQRLALGIDERVGRHLPREGCIFLRLLGSEELRRHGRVIVRDDLEPERCLGRRQIGILGANGQHERLRGRNLGRPAAEAPGLGVEAKPTREVRHAQLKRVTERRIGVCEQARRQREAQKRAIADGLVGDGSGHDGRVVDVVNLQWLQHRAHRGTAGIGRGDLNPQRAGVRVTRRAAE